MARSLRRKKRAHSTLPEITLTPLIDTCLILVVIFMVTSPMINNAIKVDLPKGQVKEVQGVQEDLVVHVATQGDKKGAKTCYYLNGVSCERNQITAQLTKKIGHQKNKTVFVKGDKNVSYGSVVELVDEIKSVGGIDRVALATTSLA